MMLKNLRIGNVFSFGFDGDDASWIYEVTKKTFNCIEVIERRCPRCHSSNKKVHNVTELANKSVILRNL
jgi:Zn finger protein HypA/HybF involved in hydrogenase expression